MKWAGRRVQRITRYVLGRDYRPDLGYTPCHWCGRPATTADHYPVSRMNGGSDDPANLVSACKPCNSSRGAKEGNRARSLPPPPSRSW